MVDVDCRGYRRVSENSGVVQAMEYKVHIGIHADVIITALTLILIFIAVHIFKSVCTFNGTDVLTDTVAAWMPQCKGKMCVVHGPIYTLKPFPLIRIGVHGVCKSLCVIVYWHMHIV